MAATNETKPNAADAKDAQKPQGAEKPSVPALGALDEDDEFEEFETAGTCDRLTQTGPSPRRWSLARSRTALLRQALHRLRSI